MLDRHALKALTTAVARSDGAAFQSLYLDRASAIHGLALRITGDPAHASETLQHTFVEAWRQLTVENAIWEEPDLQLFLICRRHAAEMIARHGQGDMGQNAHAMTDPVKDGTASFELLSLLQTLGGMTGECRNVVTSIYFDCLLIEDLAEGLSQTVEETEAGIRRCYAEFRAANSPSDAALDREADLLAMRKALGLSSSAGTANDDDVLSWELLFAPFGELIEPKAPPEDAFAAIMDQVNATVSIASAAETGRKTETLRAVLYVGVAAIIAILIYFALVALGDDAAATSFLELTGEFR